MSQIHSRNGPTTTTGPILNLDASQVSVPRPVILLASAMGVVLIASSWLRHAAFLSGTFDMAFYVQDVWLVGNGRWSNTIFGFHVFADHFSPILVLLGPLAHLPTAYALLAVQAAFVSLGVVPAYRLGNVLGGPRRAWLAATWYAASAAIWHAVMYDFHPVTLGVPLLMWLITAVEEGKSGRGLLFWGLAGAMVREDMAVLAGIILFHAAWRRRDSKLAAGAALVTSVGIGYIGWMTLWPGEIGTYHPWTRFGAAADVGLITSAAEMMANLFRPDAVVSLTAVMVPLLVVPPLRGWRQSWPGLAIVALNCMAPYAPQASLYYQYFAPAVPFLIWGATRSFSHRPHGRDRERLTRFATWSVFAVFAPVVYLGYGLPDRFVTTAVGSLDRMSIGRLLEAIPAQASVSATDHLLPHLATRRLAYPFPGPMQCSQSLIFYVPQTSFVEYVAVEWDSFGSHTDLTGILTEWGYQPVIDDAKVGVWRLAQTSPPSQTCPPLGNLAQSDKREPQP